MTSFSKSGRNQMKMIMKISMILGLTVKFFELLVLMDGTQQLRFKREPFPSPLAVETSVLVPLQVQVKLVLLSFQFCNDLHSVIQAIRRARHAYWSCYQLVSCVCKFLPYSSDYPLILKIVLLRVLLEVLILHSKRLHYEEILTS